MLETEGIITVKCPFHNEIINAMPEMFNRLPTKYFSFQGIMFYDRDQVAGITLFNFNEKLPFNNLPETDKVPLKHFSEDLSGIVILKNDDGVFRVVSADYFSVIYNLRIQLNFKSIFTLKKNNTPVFFHFEYKGFDFLYAIAPKGLSFGNMQGVFHIEPKDNNPIEKTENSK